METRSKAKTSLKDISQLTKAKIIEYFNTNKNNSSTEIAQEFGVSKNNVDAIITNYLKTKIHGFQKRI